MKILLSLITLSLSSGLFAKDIKVGSTYAETSAAMKKSGYKSTGLAMRAKAPNELAFWSVDEGVLIATYSTKTRKLTKLVFWICDERSRSKRKEFRFTIESFDTSTGKMTISTKKTT